MINKTKEEMEFLLNEFNFYLDRNEEEQEKNEKMILQEEQIIRNIIIKSNHHNMNLDKTIQKLFYNAHAVKCANKIE